MVSPIRLCVAIACSLAQAIVLDVDDPGSIRDAAALVAHGAQELYKGNQTGGVLGQWQFPPYYWWEDGGAWGSMLQYHYSTGDDSYNQVLQEALVANLGPRYDFLMPSHVHDTGNDDQAFWAFVAMSAAEHGFTSPPALAGSWQTIIENVWNEFANRWNMTYCKGGLKWQFNAFNNGFNYKQTISNGAFFQISARLARFTGNSTYVEWAEKIWNWSRAIGLIDDDHNVYDGSNELINCTGIDHHQWSYNMGVFLYGAAILSNITQTTVGGADWHHHTLSLLHATSHFLSPFNNATDIIYEPHCEPSASCNTDQQSMKAYLIRWLGQTALVAPATQPRIRTILRSSAMGAAAACTGGNYGNTCGMKWYIQGFDGTTGLGEQISALEVFSALLAVEKGGPIPGMAHV